MNFESVALCVRCADLTDPVDGSIKVQCGLCSSDVWMSPGLKQAVPADVGIICNRCITAIGKMKGSH